MNLFQRILGWFGRRGADMPAPEALPRPEDGSFAEDDAPFPWSLIGTSPVGGLRSVGFAAKGDLLLVVSEQGRIVIDCLTSVQLARDPMRYLVGQDTGEALGIGPLKGQVIRVAGLFGGDLRQDTPDGWGIMVEDIDEPEPAVLLIEPPRRGFSGDTPDRIWRVAPAAGVIVAGFSETGRSFVMVTKEEVVVWGR